MCEFISVPCRPSNVQKPNHIHGALRTTLLNMRESLPKLPAGLASWDTTTRVRPLKKCGATFQHCQQCKRFWTPRFAFTLSKRSPTEARPDSFLRGRTRVVVCKTTSRVGVSRMIGVGNRTAVAATRWLPTDVYHVHFKSRSTLRGEVFVFLMVRYNLFS